MATQVLKFKVATISVALASLTLGCLGDAGSDIRMSEEFESVSWPRILSRPENFDNRLLIIDGWLRVTGEGSPVLFFTPEAMQHLIFDLGISLSAEDLRAITERKGGIGLLEQCRATLYVRFKASGGKLPGSKSSLATDIFRIYLRSPDELRDARPLFHPTKEVKK